MSPAGAVANSYSLPAASVNVRIQPDASLLVREHITFDFSGPFTGAYRDIPLRKGEAIGGISVSERGTRYRRGGNTELGSVDTPGTFGVERGDHRVRIVWHYLAGNEKRTFVISYRFRGLAVAYKDVVDVNLRIWGDQWPAALGTLTSTMRLPRATKLGRSYRVWGSPVWVRGVVERRRDRAGLRAASVPAHQFVEFRVVFPRRLLRSTEGAQVRHGNGLRKILGEELSSQRSYERDRKRIDDAKRHIGRWALVLLALGLLPALVVIFGVWLVYGRERKSSYDREYEQEPPYDTRPALVPPLLRQDRGAGSNEFTATLFDLIRRGRYKTIPVTTERKVWGGLRHEDVADLEVNKGDAEMHLEPFERTSSTPCSATAPSACRTSATGSRRTVRRRASGSRASRRTSARRSTNRGGM